MSQRDQLAAAVELGRHDDWSSYEIVAGLARLFEEHIEEAAEAAHDAWMAEKQRRGVTSWVNEQGIEQMVPWTMLHESIREFDRIVVRAMLGIWGLASP